LIELPKDAEIWGEALDLRGLPADFRQALGRRAAALMARAEECGCTVWRSASLPWIERVAYAVPMPHVWAPLRPEHWDNWGNTTTVLALAAKGSSRAVAAICVRHLWVEGTLGAALRSQFGTDAPNERVEFDGDLARDVADCHIAWASGLWRDDALRGSRIGSDMVGLAACDAMARWRWSWLVGLRRGEAQGRLGLGPFDRLEAPCRTATGDMMLVAARRARIWTTIGGAA
jgi:hypothetical protein